MVVTPPRMRKGGKASYTVYKPAWNDGQPKPVVPQVQPPKPKLNGNHLAGTGASIPVNGKGKHNGLGLNSQPMYGGAQKGTGAVANAAAASKGLGAMAAAASAAKNHPGAIAVAAAAAGQPRKVQAAGKQPPADDRRPSKPSTAGNAKKGQAQARKKSPKKDNSPPGRGPGGANGVGLKASKATAALITGDSAVA